MIDSELLTDDKSSHLTSNIDSVYSFFNKDKKDVDGKTLSQVTSTENGDVEEGSENLIGRRHGVDLQQLMLEINAGVLTPAA